MVTAAVLVLCLDALALRLFWGQLGGPTRTVRPSRETTYILKPLGPDGLPDYRAFLHRRQLGSHPRSSNALLELYTAIGPRLFMERSLSWATADLGLSADQQGALVRTEAYAHAACPLDERRCAKMLDDALSADCVGLSGEPAELVRAWIASNGRALDAARRAGEKPMLYAPFDEQGMSSLAWNALLPLERALVCRGTLRFEQGDYEAAAADVVTLWKLAELSRTGHGLLPAIFGFAVVGVSNRLAAKLAASGDAPPRVADELLRSIPIIDDRSLMIAWIEHERIEALFVLVHAARAKKAGAGTQSKLYPQTRAFDLERVFRRVNDSFDRLDSAASAPTRAARLRALSAAAKLLHERWKRSVDGLEVIRCAVPFARRWCTLNERIGDLVFNGKAMAHTMLPKLHEKMASVEEVRRALLAARARTKP